MSSLPRFTVLVAPSVSIAILICGSSLAGLLPYPDLSSFGDSTPGAAALSRAGVAASMRLLGSGDVSARLPAMLLAAVAAILLGVAIARVSTTAVAASVIVVYATVPFIIVCARHLGGVSIAQSLATLSFAWAILDGTRTSRFPPAAEIALTAVIAWCALATSLGEIVLPVLAGRAYARAVARPAGHRLRFVSLAELAISMIALGWTFHSAMQHAPLAVGFADVVERLGHGMFPWSALCALGLVGIVLPPAAGEGTTSIRGFGDLTVGTALAGFVTAEVHRRFVGPEAVTCVAPFAVAAAVALDRFARGLRRDALAACTAAIVTAFIARDFLLSQSAADAPLGYGTDLAALHGVGTPTLLAWARVIVLALVVALALVIRRRGVVRAVITTGALAGAVIVTQCVDPALARTRSPRDAWLALAATRRSDEPVAFVGETTLGADRLYANVDALVIRDATAAVRWLDQPGSRRFLVMPPDLLASANREWRAHHPGVTHRNLQTVFGATDTLSVAVSNAGGVRSLNPLDSTLPDVPLPPTHISRPPPVFDDAIALDGFDLASGAVHVGSSFEIVWHFRSLRTVARDPHVFVHVDGPCPRINGDHVPDDGHYPVSRWLAGDVILDRQRLTIPWHCPAGTYTAFIGFFDDAGRLRATSGSHDSEDRAIGAVLEVH